MPKDAYVVREDEGDGEDGSVGEGEGAVVAGLAAAGVEAGLVECDGWSSIQ